MNHKNLNSDVISRDREDFAKARFIALTAILAIFLFSTIFIPSINNGLFYDEVLQLNQKYTSITILLFWLPYFLFCATIIILGSFLKNFQQNNEDNEFKKVIFSNLLSELHKPKQKKAKVRAVLFWIFLSLAFLSLLAAQLFLHLGMAFLI